VLVVAAVGIAAAVGIVAAADSSAAVAVAVVVDSPVQEQVFRNPIGLQVQG